MESVYVPGTRQERIGIEQPAIDLYDPVSYTHLTLPTNQEV